MPVSTTTASASPVATVVNAGALHVREAVRLAFASAHDEKLDVPDC